MANKNQEIAKRVVDRMVEAINTEGYLPWVKPWGRGSNGKRYVEVIDGHTEITIPVRHWSRNGRPYNGLNILLLGMSGKTGEWITFNQCRKEGGHINKGAKGREIVYWNMIRKESEELDDEGNKKIITIPVLKYFTVFNVKDDTDLEEKHHPDPIVVKMQQSHWEPVEGDDEAPALDPAAEAIIAGYVARCQTLRLHNTEYSDRAYYRPSTDEVVVPNVTQFAEIGEYYSTTFHELGHSTGHSSRLNRFTGKSASAAWGDENYSREELVAEIAAASILNTLGLESGNSFRNSAAYVKSWSEHIKNDPMMFVTAASRAEKAIDLILGTATC